MSKNAILVLANDMTCFKTLIDNLPDDDFDLIVTNESRYETPYHRTSLGDKTDIIKQIAPNAIIIKGNDIVNDFAKSVVDTEFLHNYTMGLNILAQWYVFKHYDYDKILFVDDDVIIHRVDRVFDFEESAFFKISRDCGKKTFTKNSDLYKLQIEAFCEVFDLIINEDNYRTTWYCNHINGGQRLYIRKDITNYEQYLKNFFTNKKMEDRWNNRQTWFTGLLDEWFEGLFSYKEGLDKDNKLNYNNIVKVDYNKPESLSDTYMKKKYDILHYPGDCKHEKLAKLKEFGYIK